MTIISYSNTAPEFRDEMVKQLERKISNLETRLYDLKLKKEKSPTKVPKIDINLLQKELWVYKQELAFYKDIVFVDKKLYRIGEVL